MEVHEALAADTGEAEAAIGAGGQQGGLLGQRPTPAIDDE